MKMKPVDLKDIEPLVKNGAWVRRQGLSNALPPTVNLPSEKLYHVTVSGSLEQPRHESKQGQSGEIVVAWEVFRFDPNDAPKIFNTEHYFVVREGDQGLLFGPYKTVDPAHWLQDVPAGYDDCEVLMSRTKS